MAMNPDPRPGRWMLPLVVLGMLLFTYVFVSQLPGSGPDEESPATTLTSTPGSTNTTLPDGGGTGANGDTATPTTAAPPTATPEVEAYRAAMTALGSELNAFNTELDEVNAAWDADPRGIEYSAAEQRFRTVAQGVGEWAQRVEEVAPPESLTEAHANFVAAAQAASTEAAAVLDGLVNSPGPEERREAAGRFDAARQAFEDALAGIQG